MSKSGPTSNARPLGLTRLSLYALWVLSLCSAPVNGQDGCTTFPCSISIAQYSLAPPPGQSSAPPAPAAAPAPTPASSTTSSSSSSSSKIIPSPSPEPPLPNLSPAAAHSPVPQSHSAQNGASTSSPANTPSSSSQRFSSSSSLVSSPTTTQLRLPTYSTSSSILPSITKGPNTNSTSGNSTSSTQCGQCSMAADQVQVYYWPTASVNSNCARASAGATQASSPKYATNGTTNATQTLTALASAGSTDVINGFTLYVFNAWVNYSGPC